MAEKGERMPSGGDTRKASLKNIRSLSDLGLKEHESAEWQQLAKGDSPGFVNARRSYSVVKACMRSRIFNIRRMRSARLNSLIWSVVFSNPLALLAALLAFPAGTVVVHGW